MERGQPLFRNFRAIENLRGPLPIRHIQQQRARRVSHVDRSVARQPIANVVFGQHDVPDARPTLRLVFAHPQQLRQREIRQRRIAGELNDVREAKRRLQFLRLPFCALVAPDNRGTNHVARCVEHHRSVHLSRKTDARHVLGFCMRRGHRLFYSCAASAPPVHRILLGPAVLWRCECLMLVRSGRHDLARRVDQKRACSAGSNVNSQKELNGGPPVKNCESEL